MRLLYVHERFGDLGGAEANVRATATELKDRGHTIGLLHGPGTGLGEGQWRQLFAESYPLNGEPASAAQNALAGFRPDVIYLHKLDNLAVLETLAQCPKPVVHMVHDHDLYCLRRYKYHYLSRAICRRSISAYCLFPCGAFVARNRGGRFPIRWVSLSAKRRELELNRRFHCLIVATRYMREELIRNGFDARKIEIHAPVPRPVGKHPQSSFDPCNRLVYAGQIIRGKGVDVLLESLARVAVPFECLVFGEGHHRPYCEALSRRLGLDQRVRFLGYQPQEQIVPYYQSASAGVMSSLWPEPFGAAGLEAMRHGLPVVAFDAGGIREWLVDGVNGFLVPWMDRSQFAGRVTQLLLDKDLARALGRRALETVNGQGDFARYITNLEDLFDRLHADPEAALLSVRATDWPAGSSLIVPAVNLAHGQPPRM